MFIDIVIVLSLIILSGLFSGLTIGLVGLSKSEIIRASETGDEEATKVLKIKDKPNHLLVTLLFCNTAVNAALAIFLGLVVGEGIIAGFVSTFLIMIFGEILPAALISKNPLSIGSKMTPFVSLLMFITYPISKPISILLDKFIGVEGLVIFNRKELKHIVEQLGNSKESDIDEQDKKTLVGAILLSEKKVEDHMSTKPYTIEYNTKITKELLKDTLNKGFTRIPIIKQNELFGILNVKNLIGIELHKKHSIQDFVNKNQKPLIVSNKMKLDNLMTFMIRRNEHIAIVKAFDTFVGVITLEDILEEVLLTEIKDEFDN